jgi:hypothetical protein
MSDSAARRARLQEAKRQIEAEHQAANGAYREHLERRAALERWEGHAQVVAD